MVTGRMGIGVVDCAGGDSPTSVWEHETDGADQSGRVPIQPLRMRFVEEQFWFGKGPKTRQRRSVPGNASSDDDVSPWIRVCFNLAM